MPRYIDAYKIPRHGKRGGECYWREIEQLPTADVVEVVRCKDCKKREHCRTTNTWAVAPSDDWFCDAVEDWFFNTTDLRQPVEVIHCLPSAQPRNGEWIDYSDEGYVECPFCHSATNCEGNKDELHYCFSCGAELR